MAKEDDIDLNNTESEEDSEEFLTTDESDPDSDDNGDDTLFPSSPVKPKPKLAEPKPVEKKSPVKTPSKGKAQPKAPVKQTKLRTSASTAFAPKMPKPQTGDKVQLICLPHVEENGTKRTNKKSGTILSIGKIPPKHVASIGEMTYIDTDQEWSRSDLTVILKNPGAATPLHIMGVLYYCNGSWHLIHDRAGEEKLQRAWLGAEDLRTIVNSSDFSLMDSGRAIMSTTLYNELKRPSATKRTRRAEKVPASHSEPSAAIVAPEEQPARKKRRVQPEPIDEEPDTFSSLVDKIKAHLPPGVKIEIGHV